MEMKPIKDALSPAAAAFPATLIKQVKPSDQSFQTLLWKLCRNLTGWSSLDNHTLVGIMGCSPQ